MEPLKNLHREWGDRVAFVDVVIRQAHPGPAVPPYRSFQQKLRDAEAYQMEEEIPWTIVVDDLEGRTHQIYGSLADPTYLIDRDGRVAFYNMWTYAPALHEALTELREQDYRGVVKGGVDRIPYLLPALVDGWPGIERGLAQSLVDLELASPGAGTLLWVGDKVRPAVAPFARRSHPLPASVWGGILAGAAALAFLGARRLARR